MYGYGTVVQLCAAWIGYFCFSNLVFFINWTFATSNQSEAWGGNYSFRNRPHLYLYWYTGLLALYLRPYGYASVYGRWSGIGIAVGIKLLCKAITISCFWCNYHHYCPDYLLYGSYRSYPTFLVLCHGSCDCAPADWTQTYFYGVCATDEEWWNDYVSQVLGYQRYHITDASA